MSQSDHTQSFIRYPFKKIIMKTIKIKKNFIIIKKQKQRKSHIKNKKTNKKKTTQ